MQATDQREREREKHISIVYFWDAQYETLNISVGT